ncbi:HAD family hydrolase [Methanolobus mangrovi]|uniref:HAD family hydrolase n=1 Tax=Methanolobus mangrovi TaxID=3072977 RepID=A0AA51UDF5_9EURY|nr:HAD family hydrolase [Methanolobus mangrovi]WMW21149.1 HAD family hydrolase [Methanolobus mangrovi]
MKEKKIKGVIFDMDNTLFDFVKAKIAACTAIIKHIGTGDPHELLSYFRRDKYGFEDVENISDYLVEYDLYSQEIFQECCTIYQREKIHTIELYPDVKRTMLELKSMELSIGILTDADKMNARKRLQKVDLCGCFDSLFTFDMTGWKKPSHEPFMYALDSMGLAAHETLFVGDSLRRDISPSKQIGMMAVYAVYGDCNPPVDSQFVEEKPDHVINNFRDLLAIIQNGNKCENDGI